MSLFSFHYYEDIMILSKIHTLSLVYTQCHAGKIIQANQNVIIVLLSLHTETTITFTVELTEVAEAEEATGAERPLVLLKSAHRPEYTARGRAPQKYPPAAIPMAMMS